MQPGGSPQIDLEPLPACGADQSPHKAFVENQPAQAQRKTLFRFERLDTQSEIGGLWEPISPLYWLAWESLTHSKTNTQRQLHMIKPKHTDRNTHTLVSVNSFIGCTHFTHNCIRAVISINKHVVMQNTSINLQTCINSHMQTSKSYKLQVHKHNDCMRTHSCYSYTDKSKRTQFYDHANTRSAKHTRKNMDNWTCIWEN